MQGVVKYACAFIQLRGDIQVDPTTIDTTVLAPLLERPMYGVPGSGGGMSGHGPSTDQTSSVTTYPVFSVPPAVLFYGMDMQIGDTKSCSFG